MRSTHPTTNNTCVTTYSRADFLCTVRHAQPSCSSVAAAPCSNAGLFGVVVFQTQPFGTACIGGARTLCAVPEGAVPEAEKLATNLWGVAGWISAGQLRLVLAAMPAYFHRIAKTTRSHTLAIRAVLSAQTFCDCLGGAAIKRAKFL